MAKNAGLDLRETDLSTIVTGPGGTFGAACIWSEKGPFEERFLATSTKQFREVFGAEKPGLIGHYDVLAALQQGPVYVVRTALGADNPLFGGVTLIEDGGTGANAGVAAGVPDPDAFVYSGDMCMLIVGADPGAWNNNLKGTVVHSTVDAEVFTIAVWAPDSEGNYVEVESFDVSRVQLKKDGFGKSMYMKDVINGKSAYIRVADNSAVAETVRPEEQLTQLQFTLGDIGTIATSADIAAAWDTFFKNKNEVSVQILIACGWHEAAVSNKLSEVCGVRQDCIAILDTDNVAAATAITSRDALSLTDPSYCGMYYPWVKDTDETNDKKLELPPSGYVAAAIMKKNKDGNLWDSAFGIDAGVIPVEGVAFELDEPTQELLAQAEINPIINKPGVGTTIWGGRTMQPYDSARSWLNVRELLNYSEVANLDYLERFIGKNNTAFRRLQVKSGLDAFYAPLIGDAFYDVLVVCDDTNNPGSVIDAGELHVDVYVQPVRPINRIRLQVVITRTGISLTEVATGVAA